jgi:hypothetical protein
MPIIEFKQHWLVGQSDMPTEKKDEAQIAAESFLITFMLMLLFYHFIAAAFDKYKPSWGH